MLQGVISNYDTDLFTPLIKKAAELTGATTKSVATAAPGRPVGVSTPSKSAASLRVIADHARAATFLIADGVIPGNEGRNYVLRKIMRRAMNHGRMLGARAAFLNKMVPAVCDQMKDAYPEIVDAAEHVSKVVRAEEGQFARTFEQGLEEWDGLLRKKIVERLLWQLDAEKPSSTSLFTEAYGLSLKRNDFSALFEAVERELGLHRAQMLRQQWDAKDVPPVKIEGEEAFRLWDTFGLSLDFMQDLARDQGHELDATGFDRAMAEQRERARASWKGAAKQAANPAYQNLAKSEFEGYSQTKSAGCEVLAILRNAAGAQELKPGEEGEIILDHTPFYTESGGQVGDRGWLYSDDHNTIVAEVRGCYYPIQGVRAHQVTARQMIRVGDKLDAVVDTEIRRATMRNHTGTHLLHAALRETLGKHVKQAGSLVAPNHLRFDFSHFAGVEDEELQDIEDLINKEVLSNIRVETIPDVPIEVAVNEYKAMALFGEKYGDRVRVIKIGDFSTELCGGTHTAATGEIGLVKILKEGSVSSGVRRIEAITGEGSLQHFRRDHELENVVASLTNRSESEQSPAQALKAELEKRDAEIKRLTRDLDQARMKSASSTVASVNEKIKDIRGVKVLAHRVDNLERAQMRTLIDQLRDKLGSGVVVLGSASDGNVSLIACVTKDLTSRVQAGKVIAPVAQKVGGKGGGRPDMAEAGGKDPAALDAALAEVYNIVDSLLA